MGRLLHQPREHLPFGSAVVWEHFKHLGSFLAFLLLNVTCYMKINSNMLPAAQKNAFSCKNFCVCLSCLLFFMIMIGWQTWEVSQKWLFQLISIHLFFIRGRVNDRFSLLSTWDWGRGREGNSPGQRLPAAAQRYHFLAAKRAKAARPGSSGRLCLPVPDCCLCEQQLEWRHWVIVPTLHEAPPRIRFARCCFLLWALPYPVIFRSHLPLTSWKCYVMQAEMMNFQN